jgi:DNA-binding transcriptional LysR family regulator
VTLALEATVQGLGIGLGWEFMISDLIKRGVIKRVGDFVYEPNMADYLVHKKGYPLSKSAQTFKDWLLDNINYDKV